MRAETFRARLSASVAQWFSPREVMIRRDGRVTYVVLSTNRQIVATCAAGCLLLSIFVSGIGWFVSHSRLQQRDLEVVTARSAYVDLLAEVSEYYDEVASLARNMESNEAALLGLVKGQGGDSVDVGAIEAQVAQSKQVRDEGLAGSAELRQKLRLFENDLRNVVSRSSASSRLARS